MASNSIPVVLCGKIPTHVQATIESLKPEYDVIKVCSDIDTATAAVSALLSPTAVSKPRLIIMGGGFSAEEFNSVYDVVSGAKDVPWVRPIGTKPGSGGPPLRGPPPAEEIARRARKVLDDHFEEIKDNRGAGQIWWM